MTTKISDTSGEHMEHVRHSLAHLLAAAVLKLYPDAKLTLGPAIDTGFYYDIDFGDKEKTPGDKDLSKIEKEMKKILPTWKEFTSREVSADEAKEIYKDNPYKLELINEIAERGEKITLYTCGTIQKTIDGVEKTVGGFTDLCRGGHEDNLSNLDPDSFKLDRVAGAYWRGDEKNPVLTRIYGLAFENKEALEAYTTMREEAKARDHKKIGKELGLFFFSELVGPGLPLWTPKGTLMRELLNDFVWELRKEHGYQKVTIPHITKRGLYETSGHWAKYGDDLFKIHTREGHEFAMKPMNCPHHTQIFDSSLRSYRDMPQRYCETTMVYRDEQSGELSGLSRVLSITQDDAHVFCRENQVEEEILNIWDIIDRFYGAFGFDHLQVRFSRHDPDQFEKYLGTPEMWASAENAMKDIMKKRGVDYIDGIGESAFYGPKLDFIAHDSLGRTLQVATIQLDFNMPKNFGLFCINEQGEKETIVMIHCAIMGSIERFMSTMIEHTAGHFPVWLSPVQVVVLPISPDIHGTTTHKIVEELSVAGIRTEHHNHNDSLGKRIRAAKLQKVPYVIIVGDNEKVSNTITVEGRNDMKLEGITVANFITRVRGEIENHQ